MKAKTVKEGLIAIKWILENKGWHQGCCFRDANGKQTYRKTNENIVAKGYSPIASCCLYGAALLVEYQDPNTAFKVLNALNSCADYSMPSFNDAKGRTKEEVIALLDKVIRRYQ